MLRLFRKIWQVNGSFYIDPRSRCLVSTPYCPCLYSISVHTQDNEHLNCPEVSCSGVWGYNGVLTGYRRTDEDGNEFLFYPFVGLMPCRYPGQTTMYFYIRWRQGHSPYPSVDKMTIDMCGIRVWDNASIPKAPDDAHPIASLYHNDDNSLIIHYYDANGQYHNETLVPPGEDSLQ